MLSILLLLAASARCIFIRQNSVCDTPEVMRTARQVQMFTHNEKNCAKALSLPDFGFIFKHRYFTSIFETVVADVFHRALSQIPYGSGLVLDIGANTGWFAALSAHCYGAKVHAFEPQIECMVGACKLMRENAIDERVDWHINFVASRHFKKEIPNVLGDPNVDLPLVELSSCDPGFSSGQTKPATGRTSKVSSVIIDELFRTEHFAVVKIDTEGHEIEVLESMRLAFQQRRVGDMVVEVAPKRWPSAQSSSALARDCRVFVDLVYGNGYAVSVLGGTHKIASDQFEAWVDRYIQSGGNENLHIYKV